jgi:ATP-dependent protease HslVU (ClpYQ) peptidase subunit
MSDDEDDGDDRPRGGHDVHFLERLERVSAEHMEMALSLYQDPELVRHILEQVKIPDGVERVAIALGEQDPAPHAIVARSGAFVTCLAAGMVVGSAPIITWDRVEAIGERFRDLRERMRDYDRRSKRTRTGHLFSRVVTAGDSMSREEFIALSAWAPIAQGVFLKELTESLKQLDDIGRQLGHIAHPRPRDHRLLEGYWASFWAIGHWTLLLGIEGRELYEQLNNDALGEIVGTPAFSMRHLGLALRGLWAVGRIGKPVVGAMRRAMHKASSSDRICELMLGLTVIAERNSKLRGIVDKGLAVRDFAGTTPENTKLLAEYADGITGAMRHVFANPEETMSGWRALGTLRVSEESEKRLPEGHPLRYVEVDDVLEVPELIAYPAAVESDGDPFDLSTQSHSHMLMAVPWLARCEAEDFYFPENYLRATGIRRFDPDRAMTLVKRRQMLVGRGETVRHAEPRPGRNDKCPCGSGKKFKHCHGK